MYSSKKLNNNEDSLKSSNGYIKIVIRPTKNFKKFKTVKVDNPLDVKRVHGRRDDCSWSVQSWIVSKNDFSIMQKKLIPKNKKAANFLSRIPHKHLDLVEL